MYCAYHGLLMVMPQQEPKQSCAVDPESPARNRWARLRGFGPAGILTIIVIPFAGTALIGALLVLLWVRLTRTPLREIGFVAPKKRIRAIAGGILFGVAFKLV